MDFFKSVFSDDPDPSKPASVYESSGNVPRNEEQEDPDRNSSPKEHQSNLNYSPDDGSNGGGWSFGGLIKTLTSKSESVIDTYRRDLQEFSSGLKKEIEVAQGSLETVGHVIDEFGNTVLKGTAQIISQGKDTILASDGESDSDNSSSNPKNSSLQSLNSKRYSRFDSQVRAIQGDASTYCDEPEDLNDYKKWKSEFSLKEKDEEIETLLDENDDIDSIYKRVVPNIVDHETFWSRYYYKIHKLKQAEDFRAKLVRGAISREEEDLSWDVDDDEEYESKVAADIVKNKELGEADLGGNAKDAGLQVGSSSFGDEDGKMSSNEKKVGGSLGGSKGEMIENLMQNREPDIDSEPIVKENLVQESAVESVGVVDEKEDKNSNVDHGSKVNVTELSGDKTYHGEDSGVNKNDYVSESNANVVLEKKADLGESCNKDNNSLLVSGQSSMPDNDEDLGWDEIEDLSSIEEKKPTQSGSPIKADLRKRLSAAEEEEEEDLSWDIEDDDEPAKT
ncbi:BSD domain-containing protein 1 [Quillaja saponaria]|uniref:BSD domain-containing protein 1 n=1 Tax=Quillaja saponaria TaxID=32244 RepID=A0AAD7Q9L8_QUISA|nr:BSD domain-containing protein 1 [Quillaja saponaria]